MNLKIIRVKNQTKYLVVSITKICETLIEQTHRKAEDTLKFKMVRPRETFLFNPSISIEGSWMIALTGLEVYNSVFNTTEENKKFEHYKFPDERAGDISNEKGRDENERDLETSDITAADLEHVIIGPNNIE